MKEYACLIEWWRLFACCEWFLASCGLFSSLLFCVLLLLFACALLFLLVASGCGRFRKEFRKFTCPFHLRNGRLNQTWNNCKNYDHKPTETVVVSYLLCGIWFLATSLNFCFRWRWHDGWCVDEGHWKWWHSGLWWVDWSLLTAQQFLIGMESIFLFCCRSCLKGEGADDMEYYNRLGLEDKSASSDAIKKGTRKNHTHFNMERFHSPNPSICH